MTSQPPDARPGRNLSPPQPLAHPDPLVPFHLVAAPTGDSLLLVNLSYSTLQPHWFCTGFKRPITISRGYRLVDTCGSSKFADPGSTATQKALGRQILVWAGERPYLNFCSSAWPASTLAALDSCPPGAQSGQGPGVTSGSGHSPGGEALEAQSQLLRSPASARGAWPGLAASSTRLPSVKASCLGSPAFLHLSTPI